MLDRKLVRIQRRLLLLSLAIFLCAPLRACSAFWYLEVVDAGNPQQPTFCISSRPGCKGLPYSDGQITILKVSGSSRKTVWMSETVFLELPLTFKIVIWPSQ